MEDRRFDSLTRTLTRAGSRRRAFVASLAGTLGLLGLDAAAGTTQRRSCPKPPGCTEACRKSCVFCLVRVDGPLLCAEEAEQDCGRPCESDNDCLGVANRPYCVKAFRDRATGQLFHPCNTRKGRCTGASPCVA